MFAVERVLLRVCLGNGLVQFHKLIYFRLSQLSTQPKGIYKFDIVTIRPRQIRSLFKSLLRVSAFNPNSHLPLHVQTNSPAFVRCQQKLMPGLDLWPL